MSTPILWKRLQQYLCRVPALGLTLDVSRMRFEDSFLDRMAAPMQRAFEAMGALERGAIANRKFYADARRLEQYARARAAQKMAV
jgi:glucose-6-phosphate isomerase